MKKLLRQIRCRLFGHVLKIVVCECGTQNIVEGSSKIGTQFCGTFGHEFVYRIKCSHGYCFRENFGNSKKEVIENWNKRPDWWVHESKSVYSESEYKKLVEACGGEIVETPWWEKRKENSCPHCEVRKRIKEKIIKTITERR